MNKLIALLIIICIIFLVIFSVNVGANFIPMSKTNKFLSVFIPAILGFFIIPVVSYNMGLISRYSYEYD